MPLPLDRDREVVQGAGITWGSNNSEIASVSSWGEVEAVAPGHTIVSVQAGTARANVAVEVRAGTRPVQSDLEWDLEHGRDCDEPETSQLSDSISYATEGTTVEDEDIKSDFRPKGQWAVTRSSDWPGQPHCASHLRQKAAR